jgi:hypothetical protein
MLGFNGGLIGNDRTPTSLTAIGVWTLDEQIKARRSGIWPGPGDIDANAYILNVEGASGDNQALEETTKAAIQTFVQGCKGDGIWDAIKAACILAGARTLAGALIPLKGMAPTNNGPFVSGDYDRKTGLVGNGSTKYLNSNRANNADPQNSNHNFAWLTTYTSGDQYLLGSGSGNGHNFLLPRNDAAFFRNRLFSGTDSIPAVGSQFSGGGFGMSRPSSGTLNVTYKQTVGQQFASVSNTSTTAADSNIDIFRQASTYSNCRLAFYSIGENLDLTLLNNRVSTLITDIGAAF